MSKVAGAVAKTPTHKAAGKYKVTITTVSGAAHAAGKVTVKLKKGSATKSVAGRLSNGAVTISVPKLAKGTWTVSVSWPGDSNHSSPQQRRARRSR